VCSHVHQHATFGFSHHGRETIWHDLMMWCEHSFRKKMTDVALSHFFYDCHD
jgi:hypothetical protein